MNKSQAINKLTSRYKELYKINFKYLSVEQMENWIENDSFTMDAETMLKIMLDRNEFAQNNQELGSKLGGQTRKIYRLQENIEQLKIQTSEYTKDLTNWNKSSILNAFKTAYGTVTKQDDGILRDIGAISQETSIETISDLQKIIDTKIEKVEIIANGYATAKKATERSPKN